MTTLTISTRVVGRRLPAMPDFPVMLPARPARPTLTLRDLLTLLVVREVEAFHERQEERRLAQVLSPAAIAQGAARGKIDPGERDPGPSVDVAAAVATALQAFEDGFYFVFIDDVQRQSLDETVTVGDDSRLLFVRLTPLAGG